MYIGINIIASLKIYCICSGFTLIITELTMKIVNIEAMHTHFRHCGDSERREYQHTHTHTHTHTNAKITK